MLSNNIIDFYTNNLSLSHSIDMISNLIVYNFISSAAFQMENSL